MEAEVKAVRVLVVDDDEDDFVIARAMLTNLSNQKFVLDWLDNYDAGLEAILKNQHDVYLLDYRLGEHSGLELLREAIVGGCKGPIILLTGQGDHAVDIEATSAGAMDFLVKGKIDPTLLERSIRYAIERNRVEKEKESLISELQRALENIKRLEGLIPICASCKRIRDDKGYWSKLETYVSEHSGADFSHSICPPCMQNLYPEQYARILSHKTQESEQSE